MLTQKEIQFLQYWEQNRQMESQFGRKITAGLPMSILFASPILLLIGVVYFFIPDWYMKISKTSGGAFVTVVVALLVFIFFFSFFRMHHRWENNEQLYQELLIKQKKAAQNAAHH
jgi:membrane protein YdbS with pleckstrin-like domain